MTQIRKTLIEAAKPSITPEIADFINDGASKPEKPNPMISAPALITPVAVSKESRLSQPTGVAGQSSKNSKTKSSAEPITVEETRLITMTVRLPSNIQQVLLDASFERKRNKIEPYTQQAIVAEALQSWLQKYGYQPHKG